MTIAVTTPAGNVGSHVVRMLCQAGVHPRLLLRNPDRTDPVQQTAVFLGFDCPARGHRI